MRTFRRLRLRFLCDLRSSSTESPSLLSNPIDPVYGPSKVYYLDFYYERCDLIYQQAIYFWWTIRALPPSLGFLCFEGITTIQIFICTLVDKLLDHGHLGQSNDCSR